MTDKPGMTTFAQLAEVRRVQAETGRIYSVDFSERFHVRSAVRAGEDGLGILPAVGCGQLRLDRVERNQLRAGFQQDVGLHVDVAVVQADSGET
jgi:hypothetical protein